MSDRHTICITQPAKETYLANAMLYESDLIFLKSREIQVRKILREALHLYCDALRTTRAFTKMTHEERVQFILNGIPGTEMLHERPDPGQITVVPDCPIVFTSPIGVRPSVEVMRSWTKKQRDVYIMTGELPAATG